MNPNLKTTIQALLDAADSTTPPHQLQKLKVLAAGLLLDETDLDTAVDALADDVTPATPLAEIFALAQASRRPQSGVGIGQVIHLPAHTPSEFIDNGQTFLRAGYFKTSGYHPDLQPIVDKSMLTYRAKTFAEGSITGDGMNIDTDGAGMWLCALAFNSVSKLYKSTDDGETWTDVTAAFNASGATFNASCYIKHISGVGAASVWLIHSETSTTLRRTTNGATSWSAIGSIAAASPVWIANNGSTVLVSGSNGTYKRSSDGGATFGSEIILPIPSGNTPYSETAIHTVGGKFVILGRATISSVQRPVLWVSENNGVSFGNGINLHAQHGTQGNAIGLPTEDFQGAGRHLAYSAATGRLYASLPVGAAFTLYALSTFTAAGSVVFASFGGLSVSTSKQAVRILGGKLVYRTTTLNHCHELTAVDPLTFPFGSIEQISYSGAVGLGLGLSPLGTMIFVYSNQIWRGVMAAGMNVPYWLSTTQSAAPSNVAQYMRVL